MEAVAGWRIGLGCMESGTATGWIGLQEARDNGLFELDVQQGVGAGNWNGHDSLVIEV